MISNIKVTENGKEKEYPDGEIGLIHVARDQLISFRKTTDNPKELEWEVRVYDYMLAQPDPAKAWNDYGNVRHSGPGYISKRAAVKKLGWVIPHAAPTTADSEQK